MVFGSSSQKNTRLILSLPLPGSPLSITEKKAASTRFELCASSSRP